MLARPYLDSNTMLTVPLPGVEVGQWDNEFKALLGLYADLAPLRVLEIGTWQGGTLWYWLQFATAGAQVVSLDRGPAHWGPPQPGYDTGRWLTWATTMVRCAALPRPKRSIARWATNFFIRSISAIAAARW